MMTHRVSTGMVTDSIPLANPVMITVAGPVSPARAIRSTGPPEV